MGTKAKPPRHRAGARGGRKAERRRIDPLFSDCFVRIFGTQESRGVTRALINAIFEHAGIDPIGEIEQISAEHTLVQGDVSCKTPRFDVLIVSEGRMVDLEAQRYPEDIGNRSLYYASSMITSAFKKGGGYKDLPQAVVITLLSDHVAFPGSDDIVSVCQMAWRSPGEGTSRPGTDRALFVLVELDKVRKRYNSLGPEVLSDPLLAWCYLLVRGYEDAEEVDMISIAIPTVEEFAERYGFALDDPVLDRAYEQMLSGEREYRSRQDYFERMEREAVERGEAEGMKRGEAIGLERGLEKGMAEGMEKGEAIGLERGMEKERRRIAALLAQEGVDKALIERVTQGS